MVNPRGLQDVPFPVITTYTASKLKTETKALHSSKARSMKALKSVCQILKAFLSNLQREKQAKAYLGHQILKFCKVGMADTTLIKHPIQLLYINASHLQTKAAEVNFLEVSDSKWSGMIKITNFILVKSHQPS